MKLAHLITDLDIGGAEIMLCKVLQYMNLTKFETTAISLTDGGALAEKLSQSKVPVYSLGMRSNAGSVTTGLLRLVKLLRKLKPDVLQTWLYHADFIGTISGKFWGVPNIIWNIRCSNVDFSRYARTTSMVVKGCSWLSRLPTAVIFNSEVGKSFHQEQGYRPRQWIFIPNGFDLELFQPRPEMKLRLLQRLNLPKNAMVIGHVGRFDPMKDHENLLKATEMPLNKFPNLHLVLVGKNVDASNQTLNSLLNQYGLCGRVHLMGEQAQLQDLTCSFDIAVSSSLGEGFSNAIGEAMACAVPCVVTDVGDSALIVGDTGFVVPPKNPEALSTAIAQMIELGNDRRKELGRKARERVKQLYDIKIIAKKYEALYEALTSKCAV